MIGVVLFEVFRETAASAGGNAMYNEAALWVLSCLALIHGFPGIDVTLFFCRITPAQMRNESGAGYGKIEKKWSFS